MSSVPATRAAQSGLCLNVGGEGETPGCINQQPHWADLCNSVSRTGQPMRDLVRLGAVFLFCENVRLPFPDASVDQVVTNGVPIDRSTWLGPGVQSSEIKRVLKKGAIWLHDGVGAYTKP